MMEEQTLIEKEVILKNSNSILKKFQKEIENDKSNHLKETLKKLGSDGESEASPDCSLSPVEVDSLEEVGSDGSQSPITSQMNGQVDFSFTNTSKNQNYDRKHVQEMVIGQYLNHDENLSEREKLKSLIEKEQESDSLQEFIKHENECEEEGYCKKLCQIYEKKTEATSHQENFSQYLTKHNQNQNIDSDLKLNLESNLNIEQLSEDIKPVIIGQVLRNFSNSESDLLTKNEIVSVEVVKNKFLGDDEADVCKKMIKSTESKIADEIRELKEREEELIKMRQKLNISKLNQEASPTVNLESDSIEKISTNSLCSSNSTICDSFINLDISNQSTCLTNESPIEKEIRDLNEREKELKVRKGYVSTYKKENFENLKKDELIMDENKCYQLPLFKQNSCGISNSTDIQKLLATTRIQQEIEEQTQREIALKATGSIKTISQERTDVKVAKLGQSDIPIQKDNSILKCDKVAKSVPSQAVMLNQLSNESSLNKRPTLSSIFQIGKAKNISMHKFIASKGKVIQSNDLSLTFNPVSNKYSHYQDLKPPCFVKGKKNFKNRLMSVESKIQEELKEMKVREDELRRQRARLLGLSQPNLNLVGEKDEESILKSEAEAKIKRITSNPNINKNQKEKVCQAFRGVKKKNPLIAQWEEKINQNVKKDEKLILSKT